MYGRKEGDSIAQKTKKALWRDEQTKQYNLRIMYDTGIPAALDKAAKQAGETVSLYIKKSIVMRLREDGFLTTDVVLNKTAERHRQRIQRLKEYIAAEEAKTK